MTLVHREETPEEKRAAEARFVQRMNDARAAAEADPSHPSRPYFGLPRVQPGQGSPASPAGPPQDPPMRPDDLAQDDPPAGRE